MEKKKHTHNNRIQSKTVNLETRILTVTQAQQMGLRKIDKACVKVVKKKSVQLTVTQRFNQRFVTMHESPEQAKRFATSQYDKGSYKIEWLNKYGNKELLSGNCDRLHGLRRHAFQSSRSDMFGMVCDTARRGENEQLLIELHERTNTQENEHGEWVTKVLARRSLIVIGGRKDTGTYATFQTVHVNEKGETEEYTERVRTTNDKERKDAKKLVTRDSFIQRWKGCTENQRLHKLYNRRCKRASKDSILGFALSPRHAYYAEQSWTRYNAWLSGRVRRNAGKPASTATERAQAFVNYFANVITVREEQQIIDRFVALGFMIASPVNACRKQSHLDFSIQAIPAQAQGFILNPLSEQALQDRLKYCRKG